MRIQLDGCEVDLDARRVRRDDATSDLTDVEVKLIGYLHAHAGRAVPRDELLASVWGYSRPVVTRCVDTAMRRLRVKIERDPAEPRHLLKVHGVGYRFDPRGRPVPAAPAPVPDLAAEGRFVGRDAELTRLGRLLEAGERLIAVVGPPGSGRTRLVREAAMRYGGRFTAVTSRAEAAPGALVLLDDPSPDDLDAAADATVLVAARGPLGRGEATVLLSPLPEPDALALYADRAPEAERGTPALVEVLGGLPAAIEEAARRAVVLSPADVVARRDDWRALLPRTAASVDRGLDALDERDALSGLAAFAGPFDLLAAERVLPDDPLAVLERLVARGWVVREPSPGPARFRVPWPLRPPPSPAARIAHLAWVLERAEALHADVRGPKALEAHAALDALRPELLLAHRTAVEADPVAAVRLMVAYDAHLGTQGPTDLHLRLLDATAALVVPPVWRTRLLQMRGERLRMAYRFGDARRDLVEAVSAAEASGDPLERACAVGYLATLDHTVHDDAAAEAGYRRAIALMAAIGHDHYEAHYLGNLGGFLVQQTRLDEAEPMLRRVLELRIRGGNAKHEAKARADLGWLLASRGRHGEAERQYRKSIEGYRAFGDVRGVAQGHNSLGLVLLDQGRLEEAGDAFRAAIDLAAAADERRSHAMATGHLGVVALLAGRLDEAEERLRECVDLHRRTEQPALSATALAWIGAVEASSGRTREAEATFLDAREALEALYAPDTAALLEVLLATLDRARGGSPAPRLDASADAQGWSIEVRLAARFARG